jgi:hypothetical protein
VHGDGGVVVVVDDVAEVEVEGREVGGRGTSRGGGHGHALEDVEDDGGEAVGVEVDFLRVGDLANFAGGGA